MAGLALPSTFPMNGLAPPSTSVVSMDAAAPPSTSILATTAPPSTSPTAAPAPPSTSPTAAPALPSNSSTTGPEKPFISSMPAPAAPPSTSTMAFTGDASKKRPRHELPRSGCKKKKKTVVVQEEPVAKGASPRVYSPKIVATSPGVNMLARSAALKRASSAVRHASAKRAKSTDQLETPASQRTPLQNTPSLQNLSPAAGKTSSHGSKRRRRKLVSNIWEEAEPIYDARMLVEGRCNRCQQNFLATRDSGTSHLRRHLKLLHSRCAPHIFNLMVQDALLAMKSVVSNVREPVQYVMSSQGRRQNFQEIINQVGCCLSKQSSVDVQTRWNSTYLMLESAIPFRSAFDALREQDKDYEFCPTPIQWKMAEAACKLLKGFYTATNLLSRSNYPTSHLYFPQLCKIRKILKRDSSSKNSTFVHMVQQMEIKLDKYLKESYKLICVPIVFDLRFKFGLLEYMLKDFGSETEANEWMLELKKAIENLFDEYSQEIPVHQQQEYCGSPRAEEDEEDDDPLAEWDHYISCKKGPANNELDQYLKEELYPRKKELDILEWWKINSPKYPVLSTIARDILAISASTVPCESAFSSGGRVVSDYRSSLDLPTRLAENR